MADPLDGARLRLAHAREHFETVERDFAALPPESKAITLASEHKANLQKIVVTIATVPSYPAIYSLEISESLFNLRAALDYTVWQLAKWNLQQQGKTRNPSRKTQFPIATAPEGFYRDQVEDLHPNHVTLIQWLQPYSEGYLRQESSSGRMPDLVIQGKTGFDVLAKRHAAFHLRRLNNQDKHHLLAPTLGGASVTRLGTFTPHDCTVTNPNFCIQAGAFEVGAKWAEFEVATVDGPDPRVDVPGDIDPILLFDGFDILQGFGALEVWVSAVVNTFGSVFA